MNVPDIRWVNWKALRAAGYKGCVFDKDNTLTEPYALAVHSTLTTAMQHCLEAFDGNVALLSNSAGLQEFDPKGVALLFHDLHHVCHVPTESHTDIADICQ